MTENNLSIYTALNEFFHCYMVEKDIDKTLSLLADDVYSVGTGNEEIVIGKEQFRKMFERELKQLPNKLRYEILDYHQKQICEGLWECFCRIQTQVSLSQSNTMFYSTRLTIIFKNENGKLIVQSMHMSEGSGYQESGEFLPIKFASEKIQELDKATQNDLWEIICKMVPGGIIGGYMETGFPLYMEDNIKVMHTQARTVNKSKKNKVTIIQCKPPGP